MLGVTMVGGPIASLAAGAEDTTTFTASYIITQADIDAGHVHQPGTGHGYTTESEPDVTDLSDDNSYAGGRCYGNDHLSEFDQRHCPY